MSGMRTGTAGETMTVSTPSSRLSCCGPKASATPSSRSFEKSSPSFSSSSSVFASLSVTAAPKRASFAAAKPLTPAPMTSTFFCFQSNSMTSPPDYTRKSDFTSRYGIISSPTTLATSPTIQKTKTTFVSFQPPSSK